MTPPLDGKVKFQNSPTLKLNLSTRQFAIITPLRISAIKQYRPTDNYVTVVAPLNFF